MYATADKAASGYLLETDGSKVWIDAGPGTWRHLQERCDWRDIDSIVLSHRHPDHTTDLFQCYHARQYGDAEPKSPIPLYAPQETLERISAYTEGLSDSFEFNPIEPNEEIEIGDVRFSFVRMIHPAFTLGMRVECAGTVLAYSADSGPTADFKALAQDANVFLCEATLQDSDEEWEGHMHAAAAGRIAAEQGCERLLLTHLPPERDPGLSLEQAKTTANGVRVELAQDGMRIEL